MKKEIYIVFAVLMVLGLMSSFLAFWPFTGDAITGNVVLPSTTNSCEDSDNNNENVSGAIKYTFRPSRSGIAVDSCEGSTLTEYYCAKKNNKDRVSKQAKVRKVDCNCFNETITVFDQTVVSARCVNEIVDFQNTCRDSDSGINASLAGVVIGEDVYGDFENLDKCLNNKTLLEYSCDEDLNLMENKLNCVGTNAGKCTKQSVTFEEKTYNDVGYCQPQEKQCSDSDEGNNQTKAGRVVRVVDATGKIESKTDFCANNRTLREFYCQDNLSIKSEDITCEDICVRGACVVRKDLCFDTDGGLNWATKGTVANIFSNASDFCLNGKTLLELSCWDWDVKRPVAFSKKYHWIQYTQHNCARNCIDGRCIQTASTSRN